MDYFAGLLLRIDVEEDAQTPGEGARHVHLVSAEKGHVGPAHLPGRQGGELGVEVEAAGEEGGGYVLDLDPVGFHHSGEEFGRRLKDRLARVDLNGGGAPDASSHHADIAEAPPTVAAPAGLLARAKHTGPRATIPDTAGRLA